jgi:hypothetical protein
MQDALMRAQHYRALSLQIQESAKAELDAKRRDDLLDLARQYDRLADKLVGQTKAA